MSEMVMSEVESFQTQKRITALRTTAELEIIPFAYILKYALHGHLILGNGLMQKKLGFFYSRLLRGLVDYKSQNKTTITPSFSKQDAAMEQPPPFVLKWSTYFKLFLFLTMVKYIYH